MDIARNDPDWYNSLPVKEEPAELRARASSQAGLASYQPENRRNHEHLPRFTVRLQNGKLASYSQHEIDELVIPAAGVTNWVEVRAWILCLVRGGIPAVDVGELLILHGYGIETVNGKPYWRKR